MRPFWVSPAGQSGRRTRHAVLILSLLATAGCVRFGNDPPDRLLTIATQERAPAGVSASSLSENALFIDTPTVPKALATSRVAVRSGDTSYAYVKDAVWVDTPARLFQSLISETVRARGTRLVLDPGQYLGRTGNVLNGDLIEFGVDAARQQAVVTYDATILSADGKSITRQRFTASAPVGKIDADTVAPAISKAANDVAIAVANWIASRS